LKSKGARVQSFTEAGEGWHEFTGGPGVARARVGEENRVWGT